MTEETKNTIKHAIISILIGAVIAFVTTLLEGLLSLLKDHTFNFAGLVGGMIYYLRRREIA